MALDDQCPTAQSTAAGEARPPTPQRPPTSTRRWWPIVLILSLAAVMLVALRQCGAVVDRLTTLRSETTLTQEMVLGKIESVAKLVSTEATIRDVVVFTNTSYGSTKRSLIVITARVSAGIDLNAAMDVDIDDETKRITITLPEAQILGIDITSMRTYDERSGLWNPFRASDRDAIFRQARTQIGRAAQELELREKANESAKQLLETMFSVDGWTAVVEFRGPLPPLDR